MINRKYILKPPKYAPPFFFPSSWSCTPLASVETVSHSSHTTVVDIANSYVLMQRYLAVCFQVFQSFGVYHEQEEPLGGSKTLGSGFPGWKNSQLSPTLLRIKWRVRQMLENIWEAKLKGERTSIGMGVIQLKRHPSIRRTQASVIECVRQILYHWVNERLYYHGVAAMDLPRLCLCLAL